MAAPSVPPTSPKVLLVHSSDELYGSDRIVIQIVESMPPRLRDNCVVVLPRAEDGPGPLTRRLVDLGVEVRHRHLPILRRRDHKRPLSMVVLAWRALALAWWLRRQEFAVVYSTTSAAVLALASAGLAGASCRVAHVQEVWGAREGRMLASLVSLADEVIATSEAVRNAFPPALRRRARVVENGVPTPDRPVLERATGGRPRYLVASRWSPRKGYETLFRAWDRAESPGSLVVAGSAPETGAAVDVTLLVGRLAHPEDVEIIGQVESIYSLLDDVDAVIIPSDKPEAFGLIAVEAFSRGRAVLAASGGGLDEIVDEGRNGATFGPGDHEGLAQILDSVQPETLATMGRHGLGKYGEKYSARAFSQRMSVVWSSIEPDAPDGSR